MSILHGVTIGGRELSKNLVYIYSPKYKKLFMGLIEVSTKKYLARFVLVY